LIPTQASSGCLTQAQAEELAEIEQQATEDREWANEIARRDRIGRCECESDARSYGFLPPDHDDGACRCWCSDCGDHREHVAEQRQTREEENLRRVQARQQADAAYRKWRWENHDSPAAQERWAREKAEREENHRKLLAEIAAQHEVMKRNGPSNGPWGIKDDPAESYRRMIVWASNGWPHFHEWYGRLFIARRGQQDCLFEMVSNEDCTDPYHIKCRAEDPDGTRYICDADCNSTFTLRQIKTLAQADAYLKRRDIHAWYLPDGWARFFTVEITEEAKAQVWADQHWKGAWRLRGKHPVPFMRPDGSICEAPGYDAATGIWALSVYQEQLALPRPQPRTLSGQLLELASGGGFLGSMTDLVAELNQRYGEQWSSKGLSCALKKIEEELAMIGVMAGPTGRTTGRTFRAEWAVVARSNALEGQDAQAREEA
jgi:hypothetical protein